MAVGDVERLAEAGAELLGDPARYAAMSTASRARAAGLFDADAIVGRYLSLYERVLAG